MSFTRRTFLAGTGLGAVAALQPFQLLRQPSSNLRVAFLTDTHLPTSGQEERAERAFRHAMAQSPDLVIFGGDNVMAVDTGQNEETADTQFGRWKNLVESTIAVPHVTCLGNHDIWTSAPEGTDMKAKGREAFSMPANYYAHEQGGWRVLSLDSYHPTGPGSAGNGNCRIAGDQLDWLEQQLADHTEPTILVSHAPIITATSQVDAGPTETGGFNIPAGWQIENLREIRSLIKDHPHVKVAFSGHMHQVESCLFDTCYYICGGAVSGSWWNGEYYRFGPAYILLDLNADGVARQQVVYWEAE